MIVVAQHRNQYYGRSRAHGPSRLGSFGSPVNCRAFESRTGLVPTPFMSCKKPVVKRTFPGSLSPRTPSPSSLPVKASTEDQKKSRKQDRSSMIAIPIKLNLDVGSRNEDCFNDEFALSELWAGPAYSNSPPPSCLPMPKFSLRPKRNFSLELPNSVSAIYLHQIAKSAPASPTREWIPSSGDLFDSTVSATQTLRRILNLEIMD